MKRNLLCLLILLFAYSTFAAEGKKTNTDEGPIYKEQCHAAKEYVTSLNFLRDPSNQFRIKESDAQKVALFVSKGCNKASIRFIKVVTLLTRVGVDSATAIITGKEFVNQSDDKTNTFLTVFKGSFLKKYLDMDIHTAKKIALSLSVGLQKDPAIVQKDFMMISTFCVENETLDLPRPKCGEYAIKIIKAADIYEGSIGEALIGLFNFMTMNKKGPRLPTYKALQLSEVVLKYGPMAKTNFETGFRYALSKTGLKVGRGDAIKFGLKMAKLSTK
ncbi:MAG: hypothetical protein KAG61_02845 [Bacteriovoracaceae bacterium]|nr:hypothetical protein [Bacteriovoracaceae bacterium]